MPRAKTKTKKTAKKRIHPVHEPVVLSQEGAEIFDAMLASPPKANAHRKSQVIDGDAPPPGLRLEWMDADSLAPNPSNWRTHPEAQSSALTAVLKEVGWAGALLYNEQTNRLIDGHLRKAAKAGEKVPVLVGSWTEAQEALILASLDPLAAMAQTDQAALDALLATVHVEDPDLDKMLAELQTKTPPVLEDDEAPIDQAAELQAKWQTSRGQLWEIPSKTVPGKVHRLMCGDSTDAGDVARVMGGERADCIISDPPYGISHKSGGGTGGRWNKVRHQGVIIAGDDKPFDPSWILDLELPCILWGANFYSQHLPGSGWLVWDKRPGIEDMEFNRSDAELAFISTCKTVKTFRHLWHGICRGTEVGEHLHPTQKPVKLMAWCMQMPGFTGSIFDPFSGSGTTLVAAEQLGRLCRAIEIEPRYTAVALERLSRLGLEPRLAD